MLKSTDDNQKSRIWDEIIKEEQEANLPLQEGEMTVHMFASKIGLEPRSARERLEALVRQGKLGRRSTKINSRRTVVYFPVPNTH